MGISKMNTKTFEVTELTNGLGHKHLTVIIEPAIVDVEIGTVLIVPYAEGFRKPEKVSLYLNENNEPLTTNTKFAVVEKYIHEH